MRRKLENIDERRGVETYKHTRMAKNISNKLRSRFSKLFRRVEQTKESETREGKYFCIHLTAFLL